MAIGPVWGRSSLTLLSSLERQVLLNFVSLWKMAVTFKSVDVILKYDHSNESY